MTSPIHDGSTAIEVPTGGAPTDEGSDMAEAMRRAEAVLAMLHQRYISAAKADLERLATTNLKLLDLRSDHALVLQLLHHIAHDMKGQGTTFNYPLVTEIGASLCRLTKGRTTLADGDLRLINEHVTALHTVIAQEITGEGSAEIRDVVSRLEQAVTVALA